MAPYRPLSTQAGPKAEVRCGAEKCPLSGVERPLRNHAKDRVVTAEEVIRREPDIIVGSWCGKKFCPEKVAKRSGFDRVAAVRGGALHEIKSSLILQPGPAALTDGLAALQAIIKNSVTGFRNDIERQC